MEDYAIIQYCRKKLGRLDSSSAESGLKLISFLGSIKNWRRFSNLSENGTGSLIIGSANLPRVHGRLFRVREREYTIDNGVVTPRTTLCGTPTPRRLELTKINVEDLKSKWNFNDLQEAPSLYALRLKIGLDISSNAGIAFLFLYINPQENKVFKLLEFPYLKNPPTKKAAKLVENIIFDFYSKVRDYSLLASKMSYFDFESMFMGEGDSGVF